MKEIRLENEGNDRAFESPIGNRYRVRIRRSAAELAKPAEGVTADMAAPTKITLVISLSLLDKKNKVQKVAGLNRIFDRREISVSDDGLSKEGYDLKPLIEQNIAEMMHEADRIHANQKKTLTYLESEWGLTDMLKPDLPATPQVFVPDLLKIPEPAPYVPPESPPVVDGGDDGDAKVSDSEQQ